MSERRDVAVAWAVVVASMTGTAWAIVWAVGLAVRWVDLHGAEQVHAWAALAPVLVVGAMIGLLAYAAVFGRRAPHDRTPHDASVLDYAEHSGRGTAARIVDRRPDGDPTWVAFDWDGHVRDAVREGNSWEPQP